MSVMTSAASWLSTLRGRALQTPYLGALVRAAEQGRRDQARDMAASIAYYTFLSLFPLLLGLVSIGGYFLKSQDVQLWVNELLGNLFPGSAEVVTRNIESVIRIRGAAGITSAVILIWSGSKMVGALSRSVNAAIGMERHYASILSPLRYFLLTLIVTVMILATMAVAPAVELLSELELEFLGNRLNAMLDVIAGRAVSLAVTGLLLAIIFTLIPFRRLPFRELLPGLLVALVLMEIGKALFVWYLDTAANYSKVYGSLSSVIVVMIWLYFAARAILFGAELISVNRGAR